MRDVPGGGELRTDRVFMDPPVVQIVLKTVTNAQSGFHIFRQRITRRDKQHTVFDGRRNRGTDCPARYAG